ncbi:MAG: hypothetical protein LKI40_01455 [Olsenella sp.]|nr:hypothetical protein [Olsenella sp.]MCI1792701.1 hypothetical protein [Olsenella sp.]
MDEPCVDESLKGRHPDGLIPREPHRHGGESGRRGLSGPKVGVVTGTDDLGDCFCCVASRGKTGAAGVRAANGRYSVRRRSLFAEPQPFWDYWEGRRPVLDVESLYPPELISGLV